MCVYDFPFRLFHIFIRSIWRKKSDRARTRDMFHLFLFVWARCPSLFRSFPCMHTRTNRSFFFSLRDEKWFSECVKPTPQATGENGKLRQWTGGKNMEKLSKLSPANINIYSNGNECIKNYFFTFSTAVNLSNGRQLLTRRLFSVWLLSKNWVQFNSIQFSNSRQQIQQST